MKAFRPKPYRMLKLSRHLARHLSQFDDFAATHHTLFRFDIFPLREHVSGHDGLVGGPKPRQLALPGTAAG